MWWSLKRKKMYSETWIEFHWLLGVWIQFRLSQNHAHLLFTYHNRSYNNTSADGSAYTYMPTMMVSASMLWQHMPAPWNQATASYYPSYMDAIKSFGVLCRNENGNKWNENRQLTKNVWVCVCVFGWVWLNWEIVSACNSLKTSFINLGAATLLHFAYTPYNFIFERIARQMRMASRIDSTDWHKWVICL